MDIHTLRNLYGRARIDDRQVNELIGLAHGLTADGAVNQAEAEYLYKWLLANKDATSNPVVGLLCNRVGEFLRDGVLDDSEAGDLLETLRAFSGGDYEVGEAQKSASLPFCNPPPIIEVPGNHFCFTGTFGFGSRRDCENAVAQLGGFSGTLTKRTNYLVVGLYATESWAHSSYGRKIEKAVELRNSQGNIAIVAEEHWLEAIPH